MTVLQARTPASVYWFALFGFLLFAGIGRLASFVLHDPLLAYANSYDMIRIQACHQIWPADKGIDITNGTPEAPLRRYTLDKHVETPCFPSSELLFTGAGIELSKLRNRVTGETLISMKTIALVKAMFLGLTVLLFSVYFFRKRSGYAFCINALMMLVVLSDPGVTLYLGTFYTEFSAAYFLYVMLAGLVVLDLENYQCKTAWPLLVGLLGLGLSKPQHIPLALLAGVVLTGYLALYVRRYRLASFVLMLAVLPTVLLVTDNFTPRNEKMELGNKLNAVSGLLSVSDNPQQLLAALNLPADCMNIAGKSWPVFDQGLEPLCPAFRAFSLGDLAAGALQRQRDYTGFIFQGIAGTKEWVFNGYGQVEGGTTALVSKHHRTLYTWMPRVSASVYFWLFTGVSLVACVLAVGATVFRSTLLKQCLFMLFTIMLMWAVLLIALFGDGMFDIGKHTHLLMPLLFMAVFSLVCMPLLLLGKNGQESIPS